MKHAYLWTALAIATLVATIVLWRIGPGYYPIVTTEFPGNITLVVIEQPWSSQEKCKLESERITSKAKTQCPACRITYSCPTKLGTAETQALHGHATSLPVVYTESSSILVKSATADAMSICTQMAAQIRKQKIQHARCIGPTKPR